MEGLGEVTEKGNAIEDRIEDGIEKKEVQKKVENTVERGVWIEGLVKVRRRECGEAMVYTMTGTRNSAFKLSSSMIQLELERLA
jgi:hypothetical protein